MLPLVQSVFNNAFPCKHCISTSVILYRAISELETQLEFERERREKLESQLDDYRAETSHLNLQIEELSYALYFCTFGYLSRQSDFISVNTSRRSQTSKST